MESTQPTSRRSVLKGAAALVGAAAIGASPALGAPRRVPAVRQGRKLTIEYWQAFGEYGSIKEINARFNESQSEIEVVSKVYNDYQELVQAVQAATAAGHPPALAGIGFNYLRYAVANLPHLTIQEVAERAGDAAYLAEGFTPNLLVLGQVDGVQHGLPFIIGTPYLSYNADLFAEAGLEGRGPRTWAETAEFARTIKDETGREGLYLSLTADFWTMQALIESNGGRLLIAEEPDAPRTGLDSPEAIEAIATFVDMVQRDRTALPLEYAQGQQSFNSGLIAMMIASADALREPIESGAFKLGTVPFPTFGDRPRKVPAGGNNLFIFTQDEAEQRAAWEYVKFATAPDQIILITQETGYPPPRLSLVDDPAYLAGFYDENPLFRAEIEQFPDVVQWASWPGANGLEIEQILLDFRDKILAGSQDVPTAARETAETINQLLQA